MKGGQQSFCTIEDLLTLDYCLQQVYNVNRVFYKK